MLTTAIRSVRDVRMQSHYLTAHPEIMEEIERKSPCALRNRCRRAGSRRNRHRLLRQMLKK